MTEGQQAATVQLKVTEGNAFYGTGRRKRSIARVWLLKNSKGILVNGKTFEDYFPRETHRMIINQPLEAAKMVDQFGIRITVKGGGPSGQAGAVRLGISRALTLFDGQMRTHLRRNGFLTRDPREKERKKFGKKGARRSFQYTKR